MMRANERARSSLAKGEECPASGSKCAERELFAVTVLVSLALLTHACPEKRLELIVFIKKYGGEMMRD